MFILSMLKPAFFSPIYACPLISIFTLWGTPDMFTFLVIMNLIFSLKIFWQILHLKLSITSKFLLWRNKQESSLKSHFPDEKFQHKATFSMCTVFLCSIKILLVSNFSSQMLQSIWLSFWCVLWWIVAHLTDSFLLSFPSLEWLNNQ